MARTSAPGITSERLAQMAQTQTRPVAIGGRVFARCACNHYMVGIVDAGVTETAELRRRSKG